MHDNVIRIGIVKKLREKYAHFTLTHLILILTHNIKFNNGCEIQK